MSEPERAVANLSGPGMPAVVEHFSIHGLHGNRTISLSSKYAATILIAKNGSGKTTLLGALDAFLKGQFSRLTSLPFSTIHCKLRGIPELLVLTHDDVLKLSSFTENSYLLAIAKQFGIEPTAIVDFLDNEYQEEGRSNRDLQASETFEAIVTKVGYSYPEARKICDRLSQSLTGRSENIDKLRISLREVLKDVEIVYLPTYRRIELPLSVEPVDHMRPGRRRKSVQSLLGISRRNLFNADIQFGLADISERLSVLNQEILGFSNQGYRETSASIINELLNGDFERRTSSEQELPSKDALKLFFARIKQGEGRYFGPYNSVAIPDIDKIYDSGDISAESNKFLTYYLSKLNRVIKTTRDIELPVENFIDNCNRYLSGDEEAPTTNWGVLDVDRRPMMADEKMLRLDRRTLQVKVEGFASKRKMSLDALSSGEKQMVSLFARLYLYPGKKIFLVDEPELSLSIDWQRKILQDIVMAPLCQQVIAITHSPFVFDNSLEPFAQALTLSIDDTLIADDLFEEEEDENG